ncbi:cytochrome oxidase putative small subunit CydP [Legionella sp. km535]|uniref:cytochrome oxidase putative small subunit CydP n=1 Tax=Legionella sp. km535 TaxID=2498107 RepID=UPI00269F5795
MKPFTRDITLTITVKMILLFLLWYVCVRGMHPVLPSGEEWMLGKTTQPASSQINKR